MTLNRVQKSKKEPASIMNAKARKKHTVGVLFSTKFAAARQVKWLRREMHLWCVKYPLTRMLKGKFHFTESAAHYFTICVKQIISHRAVREIFHYKIINMCYQ